MKSTMKKSTFFAITAFIVGCMALALALIAMGTTRWRYNILTGLEYGLFEECLARRTACRTLIDTFSPWEKASASFMVIGSIFSFVGLVAVLFISFGKDCLRGFSKKAKLNLVGGTCFLIGAVCLLIGCAVYTGVVLDSGDVSISLGFSMWLAWASAIATSIASPIAFIACNEGGIYFT